MTRVLVAVASKHGATYDIATRIASRLRAMDLHVVVSPPDRVADLDHYDAAIIGSAVYAGHWMDKARDFVEESGPILEDKPIWLFSSGPLAAPDQESDQPEEVVELAEEVGARDHHTFAGRLDRDRLRIGERIVVRAVGGRYGDFRNWPDVDMWADAVGSDLKRLVAAG